jgi:hypothetical protein
MGYERTHSFQKKDSRTPEPTTQFRNRPFAAPVQMKQKEQQTPEELENEAFKQNKFEAFGLQLKEESGTITPVEQERLGLLQAKMNDFWAQRQERASRSGFDISKVSFTPREGQATPHLQPMWRQGTSGVPMERQRSPLNSPQQLSALPLQAKLTIGEPGDQYEQEADRVASQVVEQINAPASAQSTQGQSVQRQEEPVEELQRQPSISELQRLPLSQEVQPEAMPEEDDLQAKSILQRREAIAGGEAIKDLDTAINSARGGGQPLDAGLQRSMGQVMGADFSGVRVHTDAQSDQLNQSIQAKAFTTGQDVFFRQGAYEPGSRGGQELIAHELTHVVQQTGGVQLQPQEGENQVKDRTDTGLIQKKDPESDQQGENVARERNYLRISDSQQKLIDEFCSEAHADIEAWTSMRSMHTGAAPNTDYDSYVKELRSLDRKMNKRFSKFKGDFLNTPTITTLETDLSGWGLSGHEHEIPFHLHGLAQKEVFRQLEAGYFRQYLKEMLTLHGFEVTFFEYADLFREYGALEINRSPHHYDLITIFGVEGGAGEGLTGGLNLKGFTIKYSNDLGMAWNVDTWGGAGRLGAGVSLSPVEGNIESSLGGKEINAGSADELKYYPPNYFNYNFVKLAGGSAVLGGGYSVSTLSIGDVDFNTSGIVVKAGTADVGSAGLEMGLGFTKGGDPYDFQGLGEAEKQEVKNREGNWIAVFGAKVHFRSAENVLDAKDLETIQEVVDSVVNHEKYYPGDIFKISVLGTATERWINPNKSAQEQGVDVADINSDPEISPDVKQWEKADRLNTKLAEERAIITLQELSSQIQAREASFTTGVLDKIPWNHGSKILFRDPADLKATDNAPTNRSAIISVYYNTTPEGNVKYEQ